jgi:hypothetical protein
MTTVLTLDGALLYPVELTPNHDNGAEFVQAFTEYWAAVTRPQSGPTQWLTVVSKVSEGAWGSSTGTAAGAGGTATVRGRRCSKCDGPLTLTSRTAFDQAQDDEPVRCRSCVAQFDDRVAAIVSPAAHARREALHISKQQVLDARQEQERIEVEREAAVRERYSQARGDECPDAFSAPVRTRVAALALIRRHMVGGITISLEQDDQVFAPETAYDRFLMTVDPLLAVHPSTPSTAFVWKSQSGPDAAEFGGQLFPGRLRLYRDTNEPTDVAAAALEADLEQQLDVGMLFAHEQEEFLQVVRDLLAGEGIRYLEYQLSRYSLPPIPDQHRNRLVAVMKRAADNFPIDVIYYFAWGAASGATNYFQAYPTTREKASTHALNRMEKRVAEAIDEPDVHVESYGLIDAVPLTSMTQTVFYDVLKRDLIGVSVPDLRTCLPTPFDVRERSRCIDLLPSWEETQTARTTLAEIALVQEGKAIRDALANIEATPSPVCAQGCSHDQANSLVRRVIYKWDALAAEIGDNHASVAIVATLPWLDYRDNEQRFEHPSTILTNRLVTLLVDAPSPA